MSFKRDFRAIETTYGERGELVTPTFDLRPETIQHGNATVNGSATIRAANKKRMRIQIHNRGGVEAFIGLLGVASTDGYPIPPSESREFHTTAAIAVFTAASCDLRFAEELLGADL